MKTFRKILMAMFVMACVGTMVSCNDKEKEEDSYSAMLKGTWRIDRLVYNGEDMTAMLPIIELTFNENNTGVMNDGGETTNNDFSWAISSSTITVTPRHNQFTFTITSMTANECSFTGNYMEINGMELRGTIEVHMVKANGDLPIPENFPAGTEWGDFTIDTTVDMLDTNDLGQVDTIPMHYVIGINVRFNNDTAGTFKVSVHVDVMGYGQDYSMPMPFTYTYDEATSAGVITLTTEDSVSTANYHFNADKTTLTFEVPEEIEPEFMGGVGFSDIVLRRLR